MEATTAPLPISSPPEEKKRALGGGGIQHALAPSVAIGVILLGLVEQYVFGYPEFAHGLWLVGLVTSGFPVVWRTLRAAAQGNFNTDLVATLSIVTAAIIGQPLAGLVIVLMQTGGEALEKFAERRASAAVSDLERAAPRVAHLVTPTRGVTDVPVDAIRIGDVFLLRPGDLVPCDGVVIDGSSEIDASQLTGEAIPVAAREGTIVMSGSLNLHGALSVRATAHAAESQYSRIVELVRKAQSSKSPLQRLADRYAVWFTPATLAVCVATFAISGSWVDVLAVLVVATPCPLILATPVAIIGGINQAAREKIIIRHGAALEHLSNARTAVFDKTGTLTIGKPRVRRVLTLAGYTEEQVLTYAAAVEHGSSHLLARVIFDEAEARFGKAPEATQHRESPGEGVSGMVEGTDVVVGGRAFVARRAAVAIDLFSAIETTDSALRAYVLLAGKPAGIIEYADSLRPELMQFLKALKEYGFTRRVLLSGDSVANAKSVGAVAGMNEIHGELLPADKAALISKYRARGDVVMMVGDGTNDAPALSAADVGIALSGHSGGVTSEAADIVILVDDLARVAKAVGISRRTMKLARQSIVAGLVMSGIAMLFAAYGFIAPTQGALLQEGIDVAVIINALRASWPERSRRQLGIPAAVPA